MKHFSVGNPPSLTLDAEAGILLYSLKKSSNNLYKLLQNSLSHLDKASLCLSGGGDSQFMLLMLLESNIPVEAYTYRLKWGIETVNASDVEISRSLCEKYSIKQTFIDIDAKDLLENHLTEYSNKYNCFSPQVICHLKFLEEIKDVKNIIMGDDAPYFVYNASTQAVDLSMSIHSYGYILESYRNFEKMHDVKLYKNHFFESPEIFYLACKHNIDVVNAHKKHLEVSNKSATSVSTYKYIYYNMLLGTQKLQEPLSKYTGFERLKDYFASKTGDIDAFDKKFRFPILHNSEMFENFKLRDHKLCYTGGAENKKLWTEFRQKYKGPMRELYDTFSSDIKTNKSTYIKDYNLY